MYMDISRNIRTSGQMYVVLNPDLQKKKKKRQAYAMDLSNPWTSEYRGGLISGAFLHYDGTFSKVLPEWGVAMFDLDRCKLVEWVSQ